MNLAQIKSIIFDWSGTLVDDLPAVHAATNHVFSQAGLAEISLDQFRAEFSLPFTNFYKRFTPGVSKEQLEAWFHGHFRGVQQLVVELPHAREFLEYCRSRGIRMFILSTMHSEHFANQVKVNGFGKYFERTYLEIWDKRKKIHELLQENNLDPASTLYIGDMEHDIETAHHGGTVSCAVLTGYNRLEQLRRSQPHFLVENLGELKRLFEEDGGVSAQNLMPICTVGALIYNSEGKVLMIRTDKWSGLWGIPGGKVKYGEACEAALRREILEETGLAVEKIEFVLVQDAIASREFYRPAHFVLLNYTCLAPVAEEVQLNEEAQEFRWVTVEDALQMELNSPTRILINAVRKTK